MRSSDRPQVIREPVMRVRVQIGPYLVRRDRPSSSAREIDDALRIDLADAVSIALHRGHGTPEHRGCHLWTNC